MPLPQAQSRIPESIADLSVVLTDYVENQAEEGEPEAFHTAHFEVQVKYTNGEIKLIQGDLLPHLDVSQKSSLLQFMQFLRVKAEQEILP